MFCTLGLGFICLICIELNLLICGVDCTDVGFLGVLVDSIDLCVVTLANCGFVLFRFRILVWIA